MKKVIIIINDKMGGVPNVFINVLNNMEKRQAQCSFLLLHKLEDRQEGIYNYLASDGIEARKIVYSKYDNKYHLYRQIAQHISGGETLIANDYLELESYYLNGLRNPLIYVVHGDEPAEYEKMIRFSPIIDKFVVVSNFIKEKLTGLLPARKEDIVYIPQPIPDYKGGMVRKETEGPLRLIYIGRYTKLKGQEELIDLANELKNSGLNHSWTFISNGVKEAEFKARFPTEVNSRFFADIPNEKVYELLLESDLFIFPSHREGFPLTVVEAMKCGVVPIVSNLETAIPEIVHEGVTGYRVGIGNSKGFADKVRLLNEDRELLKKMAEQAKEEVRTKFDPVDRAADYLKIIEAAGKQKKKKDHPISISTSLTGMDRKYFPNYIVRKIRKLRSSK